MPARPFFSTIWLLVGLASGAGAWEPEASPALVLWLRCTRLAGKTAALFEHVAEALGMIRCKPDAK